MAKASLDITQEAVNGFLDMKDFSIEDAARFISLYPLLSTVLMEHTRIMGELVGIQEREAFAIVFSTATTIIDLLDRSNPPSCMDTGGN